ncbi:MAG: hypothetical protein N4A49_14905 [Marinifilaceae bacterium]|jgi:hypothetical protein|nr:hypothetical protein [Marinifilaceae bacterium]
MQSKENQGNREELYGQENSKPSSPKSLNDNFSYPSWSSGGSSPVKENHILKIILKYKQKYNIQTYKDLMKISEFKDELNLYLEEAYNNQINEINKLLK